MNAEPETPTPHPALNSSTQFAQPPILPIHQIEKDFLQAFAQHPSVVLVAPTGSGKSTQLCQIIHRSGLVPEGKKIVVLQPRRIAAKSVAHHVAEQNNSPIGGNLVGYQVRFEGKWQQDTAILFITEGILLRWLQENPELTYIGCVVFDEFHERNLLSDLSLALCKRLQNSTRNDLKLVVMSATLEAQPLVHYLSNSPMPCPLVQSEGRSFPVEIHYQTWEEDSPVWERAAARVAEIIRISTEGDILVFMPGQYEIQQTLQATRQTVKRTNTEQTLEILAMHGEMPLQQQHLLMQPGKNRRVIVATNVAETSLTLPAIRYVVDSGLAKIARYDAQHGMNGLPTEHISKASAEQRAGRAGRVGPGICYRLWSEANHTQRPEKNTPEILRSELSSLLLTLCSIGITSPENFDFLDKPEQNQLREAMRLLVSLGAVSSEGKLTNIGKQMLPLPVHPRYARMLIEAKHYGCVPVVALMAALVDGRDMLFRLRREDKLMKQERERLMKKSYTRSDFLFLCAVFQQMLTQQMDKSLAQKLGVRLHVAHEVWRTYQQLLQICLENRLIDTPNVELDLNQPDLPEHIARCHLVGFVDFLGVRTSSGSNQFDMSGERRCELMDESILGRYPMMVGSEVRAVRTKQGQTLHLVGLASSVEPDWVLDLRLPELTTHTEHIYDRLNQRVVAAQITRYMDLPISGQQLTEPDPATAANLLAEEFVHHLNRFPQWGSLKPLLQAQSPSQTALVQALAQLWHGATCWEEIRKIDLMRLVSLLG